MKSLAQLFTGYGELASQDVEDVLILALILGWDVEQIASAILQALMQPLYRALTVASDTIITTFRDVLSSVVGRDEAMSGWIWICALLKNSCAACVAMHGTKHEMSESMESHVGCYCQPQFYSGEPPDMQAGSDWLSNQDEATQRSIFGSNIAYDLFSSGKFSLEDFVGVNHDEEYGKSIYQKSAKQLTKGT